MTAHKPGAGGSQAVTGFAVHRTTPAQDISNSGIAIFDVLDFASDDWTTDLGTGQYTSDGAAGLYLVSCEIRFRVSVGGPADEVWADVQVNETAWNIDPVTFHLDAAPNALSADDWVGTCSTVLPLGPACTLSVSVNRHPFTGMTTSVLANSYLRAFRIGEDASFL